MYMEGLTQGQRWFVVNVMLFRLQIKPMNIYFYSDYYSIRLPLRELDIYTFY